MFISWALEDGAYDDTSNGWHDGSPNNERNEQVSQASGRGPGGVAAACVYISTHLTGDRRTQSEIAREIQVTEVTIRNRYKELAKRLDIKMIL